MKKFLKYLILTVFGGLVYFLIEVGWRGYSHWTMFVLGGLCFLAVGLLNEVLPWKMDFEKQAFIGGIIITVLEFITGVIVNIWLKWGVWDYTALPFNILGQISLPFTLIWILLSGIIILVDDQIRYRIFHEKKPTYTFYFGRKFKELFRKIEKFLIKRKMR